MPGEEARQRAGADRDPVRLQSLAQLAQEDLRASLIGLPDEVGMSLDVAGALVAAQRLGRDVALAPLLLRPAAGAGPAYPEALGGLPASRPAETADATRWRRSTDKVVDMTASLPHQPSATQQSF